MARTQSRKKSKWGFVVVGSIGVAGAVLGVVGFTHDPLLAPDVKIGPVAVGGLSPADAERKLQTWWQGVAAREITFEAGELSSPPDHFNAEELGLKLDIAATLEKAPREGFVAHWQRRAGQVRPRSVEIEPVLKADPAKLEALRAYVEENVRPSRPARAAYEDGRIVRTEEISGVTLDETQVADAVRSAVLSDFRVELPLRDAPKRVSDDDLAKITEVQSEFSTKFNSGQVARSSNIRLAAEMINGTVLLPGERFSFNDVVGKRTGNRGFRVAGVFINGRRDVDFGGGVCQVSTTLYNAALLADLRIVRRQPHSLPVPYVPLGRDAAVDYPSKDLVFENSSDRPIAVGARYEPGRLTFMILGRKEPGLEVKLEQRVVDSWGRGVKYVEDASLPPGREKVVDRGGSGHRVNTVRIVMRDGQIVRRDNLPQSVYSGGPRIVARNSAAAPTGEAATPATATNDPPAGDPVNEPTAPPSTEPPDGPATDGL